MENQNQEQLQNIELTAEELEEIQGGVFYLPPGSLGTPGPEIFKQTIPVIRIRDIFPNGMFDPNILQQQFQNRF